ncbi:MAG: hypothetical protein R3E50_14310 [Halioglobus sp.]
MPVLVTSVHKHITGFTSHRWCWQGALINYERLGGAFEGLHTTSPSGAIFASIDRARALLQDRGEELLGCPSGSPRKLASACGQVPGLGVVGREIARRCPALLMHDPTKVIPHAVGTGADGQVVADVLERRGIHLSSPDRDTFCPLTLADTEQTVERMVSEIIRAIEVSRRAAATGTGHSLDGGSRDGDVAEEAFFADHERVPASQAIGRIAAETAVPYPPGIPALAPGSESRAMCSRPCMPRWRAGPGSPTAATRFCRPCWWSGTEQGDAGRRVQQPDGARCQRFLVAALQINWRSRAVVREGSRARQLGGKIQYLGRRHGCAVELHPVAAGYVAFTSKPLA